jgi:prephenate dehydrogenase
MAVQITIIGLGKIGASLGLALADQKEKIVRMGHDPEPDITRRAEKLGAVDKTHFNLFSAVEKADVVILALPVDEIRPTLEMIAQDLREDVVVVDMTSVKTASTQWAQELLPQKRYFITLTPSLNANYFDQTEEGIEAAKADLFKKSVTILTSPPNTPTEVIQLGEDLCSLIGTQMMFADPLEADGLAANGDLLPKLMAASLVNYTTSQPGWVEARKMTGPAYAQVTNPLRTLDERKEYGQSILLNQQNALRLIDGMISALYELRQLIAENKAEEIHKYLENARNKRDTWWLQRLGNNWETSESTPELPASGDRFSRFFLGGLFDRKKK